MKKIILLLLIYATFSARASDISTVENQDTHLKTFLGKKYFKELSTVELKLLYEYADSKFEYFNHLSENNIRKGVESLKRSFDIISYAQGPNLQNLNQSILFIEIFLAQIITKICREEIENIYASFILAIQDNIKQRDSMKSKLPVIKSRGTNV